MVQLRNKGAGQSRSNQNEELMRFAAFVAASTSGAVVLSTNLACCESSSSERLAVSVGNETSDCDRVIFGDGDGSGAFATLIFLTPLLVSTLSASGMAGGGGNTDIEPLLLLCRNRALPKDENLPPPPLLTPEGIGDVGGLISAGLEFVRNMETEPNDDAVCLRCKVAGGLFALSLLPFPDLSALLRVNSNPVHCFAHVILCRTARFAIVTLTDPDFFIRYSMPQLVQNSAKRKKSNEQNRRKRQYNVIPNNILLLFFTNAISRSAAT